MMSNDEMMTGLEEALKSLRERVPVLDAWEAIKAVKAALIRVKEVAAE